jgi:hypothetical protein
MFSGVIDPRDDTGSDNDARKAALFAAGVLLDVCGGDIKLAIEANALCGKLLPTLDGATPLETPSDG